MFKMNKQLFKKLIRPYGSVDRKLTWFLFAIVETPKGFKDSPIMKNSSALVEAKLQAPQRGTDSMSVSCFSLLWLSLEDEPLGCV